MLSPEMDVSMAGLSPPPQTMESAPTVELPGAAPELLSPPPQTIESAPTVEVPVVDPELLCPPPQTIEVEPTEEVPEAEPELFIPPPHTIECPETPEGAAPETTSLQRAASAHTPPVPRRGSTPKMLERLQSSALPHKLPVSCRTIPESAHSALGERAGKVAIADSWSAERRSANPAPSEKAS